MCIVLVLFLARDLTFLRSLLQVKAANSSGLCIKLHMDFGSQRCAISVFVLLFTNIVCQVQR